MALEDHSPPAVNQPERCSTSGEANAPNKPWYILTRERWSQVNTNADIHIAGVQAGDGMFGFANPSG